MIRIVCWNMNRDRKSWRCLAEMKRNGRADVALLQECCSLPGELSDQFEIEPDDLFWCKPPRGYLARIVPLSDRVKVEWFRQIGPNSDPREKEISVSRTGNLAVAKITSVDGSIIPFLAVSMYAEWMEPQPDTKTMWQKGSQSWMASDVSAHRILSDMSAFINHRKPFKHRVLAAGDLNMFHGAIGNDLSVPDREDTVWKRFDALGLEFLGPQYPNGRQATTSPDVPENTQNVATYYSPGQSPENADRQFDYVFASRGFYERIKTKALNEVDEWGPSDHCRIMIKVPIE